MNAITDIFTEMQLTFKEGKLLFAMRFGDRLRELNTNPLLEVDHEYTRQEYGATGELVLALYNKVPLYMDFQKNAVIVRSPHLVYRNYYMGTNYSRNIDRRDTVYVAEYNRVLSASTVPLAMGLAFTLQEALDDIIRLGKRFLARKKSLDNKSNQQRVVAEGEVQRRTDPAGQSLTRR